MLPIHKLQVHGFVVLHGVLSVDAVNALRIIARRSHLLWAAEDPTSTRLRRDSAKVPSVPAVLLSIILERCCRTFFPNIDPAALEWEYLKSYADAPDQPIHRNFAPLLRNVNPMDATALPGSLLLATQDDTAFYGYGWNHLVAFESQKVVIDLRKGDILFLRGDLIHARAGYTWNNLCIHTFLGEVPPAVRCRNQLIPLYDDLPPVGRDGLSCYVYECQYVGRTSRALSKHLSSHHNFATQSPRMRQPTYNPSAAAAEAEIIDLTWPAEHGTTLAITAIINCARNVAGVMPQIAQDDTSANQDDSVSITDDHDMEMEILIATDSDIESGSESSIIPM